MTREDLTEMLHKNLKEVRERRVQVSGGRAPRPRALPVRAQMRAGPACFRDLEEASWVECGRGWMMSEREVRSELIG